MNNWTGKEVHTDEKQHATCEIDTVRACWLPHF